MSAPVLVVKVTVCVACKSGKLLCLWSDWKMVEVLFLFAESADL